MLYQHQWLSDPTNMIDIVTEPSRALASECFLNKSQKEGMSSGFVAVGRRLIESRFKGPTTPGPCPTSAIARR